MHTKTIVGLVTGVMVLLGGWYFLSEKSNDDGKGMAQETATTTPSAISVTETVTTKPAAGTNTKPTTTKAKVVGVGTIPQIVGLKQPLVCSVRTTAGAGIARSGTLYVAGVKTRANFTNSTMIADGTYLYAWSNGASKGLQLSAASSANGSVIARNGGVDLATDLSYACNPWPVDMSVFVPPTSVTFYSSL